MSRGAIHAAAVFVLLAQASLSTAPPGTIGFGRVLFRFRSFTPVPVIALLFWLLWRSRGAIGPGADALFDVLGVVSALLGQSLRFYTLGQVPDGTSGQDNVLEAKQLNTRGPYAYVRNPLYVGNLFICLGLMLIANDPWVYGIGLLFFFGEYFFIIRAEEDFLRSQFGEKYADYCRRVRRWLPRFSPAYQGALRAGFDWRRAIKKEHNPFTAWASGAIVLFGWEWWARGELSPPMIAALVALEFMVLVGFSVTKAYKRGWLLRD